MGSEDLFHQRKAKAVKKLERRIAKRSSYDRVLMVCEGAKTEPYYFNDLVQFYKLNTANVAIDGSCGSSPASVLERAIELWKEQSRKGDPYDRVYCIFDKDTHETYDATLREISSRKPKNTFFACQSIPCFEYWLLLHFKYTTKPYAATGGSSVANEVLKELKGLFPEYAKGNKQIFSSLNGQLEFAEENAARALKASQENYTDNPSTYIHELVGYLQNLKN